MSLTKGTLKEWLQKNEYSIGKDKHFVITPPVYYTSLNRGFHYYFKTIEGKRRTYHFLLDREVLSNKETIAFSYSSTPEIANTILNFQRFFELFIKDILRQVHPILSTSFVDHLNKILDPENPVKRGDNRIQIVQTHKAQISTLDFDKFDTITWGDSIKCLRDLKAISRQDKDHREIFEPFSFLLESENIEFLEELTWWRNRIAHNGRTLPNILVLDFFVTKFIAPLVEKILGAQKSFFNGYWPHYLRTLSGIDILQELIDVRCEPEDFEELDRDTMFKIIKLGHLKELGRAAFNTEKIIHQNRTFYEPLQVDPRGKYEQHAQSESDLRSGFREVKKCPCCNLDTLVVYEMNHKGFFPDDPEIITKYWCNCTYCDYSMENNMLNPSFFGLGRIQIFPEED